MKIALQRMLVPTDFSQESAAALRCGVGLAEGFGAQLHLLHALEVIAGAEPLTWQIDQHKAIEARIEAAAWEELRRLLPAADQARFQAAQALEWGSPLDEIIRYAGEHAIELITMGTHGRRGIKRLAIGSVAENVVCHARCPVLTVRHPEREFVLS